ncbi:EAL domain-containing protein [Thiomicrospira microaerophila]|uniref:EAL domain-containing protein n=1 Tax=Thiomicrospira microaerophila TaxID=406020 RepID=UPI0005CB6CC4|nr:EAL domain-containing protein [Thiomicrospira microaerophila]
MRRWFKPIKAKWHMVVFLSASLGLYLFMFWYLYASAQQIRDQSSAQVYRAAQQELVAEVKRFIAYSEQEAQRLADWDEVRQQLSQPRYYFFWRNERVKVSHQWRPYFNELEIYDAQGRQLFQKGPNDPVSPFLPERVSPHASQFHFAQAQLTHRVFIQVDQRQSGQKIGYLGLNIDLVTWLKTQAQFQFIERTSLVAKPHFEGQALDVSALLAQPEQYIAFSVLVNPVDNYLWPLIQDFIRYVLLYAVLIAILFMLFFRYSLVRPLASLTGYLAELKNKPDQVVTYQASYFVSEFEDLQASLSSYNRALVQAQEKIDAQRELAYQQSRTDALSGLANRRAFDEALDYLARRLSDSTVPIGFMLLDCDYFKAINDTYGHDVGDQVIRLTAKGLVETVPTTAQTFRIGGDEFAIVLAGLDADGLSDLAKRCLNHLKQMPFAALGIQERVQFSVGLSSALTPKAVDSLHKQADIALYNAKHSLHDKIQLFVSEALSAGKTLVSNERVATIMAALQTGEGIEMHLQPIVDAQQQTLYYESLVRIKTADGLIFPGEIFDVVNHRRLEVDLDLQVIQSLTQLIESGKVPVKTGVSLNLSPQTLLQLDLDKLLANLAQYTCKYKMVVEVTETTLITNMGLVSEKLETLRKLGFQIALDDFGSGYSSIRYLANMPVDIIKFDITLTHALNLDGKTRGIIESTATMIRQAGYQLVMEGIELPEQFESAKQAGATGFQGYHFGRPQAV